MIVTSRQSHAARRSAFTLLEVLVVVAIIVILAGGASVYVFGYLEDARIDQARNTMTMLENACQSYMAKNGSIPPNSLEELVVAQSNGKSPLIDGGVAALIDPWGKQYSYDPSNVNANGDPDPRVYTVTSKGVSITSTKRH